MKKSPLVNTLPETPHPALVLAGAAAAGTLLIVPALLISLFRAGSNVIRIGQRLALGREASPPVPTPSHRPHTL